MSQEIRMNNNSNNNNLGMELKALEYEKSFRGSEDINKRCADYTEPIPNQIYKSTQSTLTNNLEELVKLAEYLGEQSENILYRLNGPRAECPQKKEGCSQPSINTSVELINLNFGKIASTLNRILEIL